MLELALKLTLAPLLVIVATLAARRWGDAVGGALVTVPIVAGPILLILGLEQGSDFIRRAAAAALLGVVAVVVYCVTAVRLLRFGWAPAIVAGWAGYALAVMVLARVEVAAWAALGAALVAVGAAWVSTPWVSVGGGEASRAVPPRWDLPARAAATALLVVALTSAASSLGPSVSGLLTPFPVATSVVVAFTCAQAGPEAAQVVLKGYLRGLPFFALFFVVVALVV